MPEFLTLTSSQLALRRWRLHLSKIHTCYSVASFRCFHNDHDDLAFAAGLEPAFGFRLPPSEGGALQLDHANILKRTRHDSNVRPAVP